MLCAPELFDEPTQFITVIISLWVIGIRKRFCSWNELKICMNISISGGTNAWCHAWAYCGEIVIDVITNFIAVSDDSAIVNSTQMSLTWTWTINNYVCSSLICLCWLNRTHFWNHLFKLFSTLRPSMAIILVREKVLFLPDVLERRELFLNLQSKLVMSLILEKHLVVLEYFPASLKILE